MKYFTLVGYAKNFILIDPDGNNFEPFVVYKKKLLANCISIGSLHDYLGHVERFIEYVYAATLGGLEPAKQSLDVESYLHHVQGSSHNMAREISNFKVFNLDTLKSRNKEMQLYLSLLENLRPVVIDNTNPTKQDRIKYIGPAKNKGYRIIGIEKDIPVSIATARNSTRQIQKAVSVRIIHGTYKKMQPKAMQEGFDEIYIVRFRPDARPDGTHMVR